jgi:hypothetical protein
MKNQVTPTIKKKDSKENTLLDDSIDQSLNDPARETIVVLREKQDMGLTKNHVSDAVLSACVALACDDERIVAIAVKQMEKFIEEKEVMDYSVGAQVELALSIFQINKYIDLVGLRPSKDL